MPSQPLLVLDLDGTLLDRKGAVSDENCAAIDRARAAGWSIALATGRALVESRTAVESLRHTGLFIGGGGSILTDVCSGDTLHRHAMPADVVRDATNALLDARHKVLLLKDASVTGYDYLAVGDAPLDPASQWWFEHLPVTVRFVDSLDDDPHPHDTVRAAVIATASELAPLAAQLRAALEDRALLQHWSAVTETAATGSQTHLLEVFGKGVNKWTAVDWWCREQDIDVDHVIAIGDGLNDVELVREAGLGIAMANADARVLDVADLVTDGHEENGVAVAIERIMSGQWPP